MNKRKLIIAFFVLLAVAIPLLIVETGIPELKQLWVRDAPARANAPRDNLSQEEFWRSALKQREQTIRGYHSEFRACQRDIERRQRLANLEQLLSELSGIPAAKESVEQRQSNEIVRDVCRTYAELLRDEQAQLKVARNELEKIRIANRASTELPVQARPASAPVKSSAPEYVQARR